MRTVSDTAHVINAMCKRFFKHIKTPAFLLMLTLVLASAIISLTGRYDIPVGMDEAWDVQNAYNLIHNGEMPRHGCVSGLHAMIPPGVSFAYVPGILLSPGNPAAAERIGASIMFFGTLLGIYFWINKRMGFWSTALAMLLFSAGSVGVFYQTSLWPRSHPFFYVWMLYMLTLWIEKRDGKFLAASLIFYAAGLYWFMEMSPALFIVPVLYFLYHPPINWRWQAVAATVALLIWSPYLTFEAQNGFSDLKSIVTQRTRTDYPDVTSVLYNPKNHLVDASFVKKKIEGSGYEEISDDTKVENCDRWFATEEWGTVWFQKTEKWYLGEPGYFFYSDKLGGWTFQSVTSGRIILQGRKDWEPEQHLVAFPTTRKPDPQSGLWVAILKKKLMELAPLNSLTTGNHFAVFAWHLLLLLSACTYAFYRCGAARQFATACKDWRGVIFKRRMQEPCAPPDDSATWCVILLGAIVPALLLSIILRNDSLFDGARRFWWIWASYAIAMGSVTGCLKVRNLRIAVPLGLIAVVTLSLNANTEEFFGNAFTRGNGKFKGASEEAIDKLAGILKSTGAKEAYIGYDMNLFDWQTNARVIDGCTKSFIEWDQVLLMRHGIRNLDNSAEGLSPQDDYVIRDPEYGYVSAKNSISAKRWSMTIDNSLPEMEVIAKTRDYEIRHRKSASAK